jgi:hypothetical protein
MIVWYCTSTWYLVSSIIIYILRTPYLLYLPNLCRCCGNGSTSLVVCAIPVIRDSDETYLTCHKPVHCQKKKKIFFAPPPPLYNTHTHTTSSKRFAYRIDIDLLFLLEFGTSTLSLSVIFAFLD